MGLWNLIRNLNNAEGIREAMRQSFDKHLRLAREGRAGNRDVTPLQVALFGAMASRFMVSGVEVTPETELVIWADLGPFLWLAPEEAREAVAEYVVCKEMPADANIRWLTAIVQKGCAAGACRSRDACGASGPAHAGGHGGHAAPAVRPRAGP
jgi:hypothetical protein